MFRQFILFGDITSIKNYGEHVQSFGNAQDYEKYKKLVQEFDKYLNYSLGFFLHRSTERNQKNQFYEKEMKVNDIIDEMFYGGNGLFHGIYNQHGVEKRHAIQKPIEISGISDENRLYEFLLALMIIICRIGMVINLPDFNDEEFCKEYCPYKIYYGEESPFKDPINCEALPIPPHAFRTFSLF